MAISSPLQSKVPTGSTKTIKKLQTILLNRTKVKREIFQRQTILQNRRIENERRKQREDELEAPNLVTKPRGAAGLIAGSAKGFFERLVGFLSYLTAGWIINNLPTWIAMGKEFIARTQQMGKILGGFITNSTDIFKNFTKLLGASLQNLMSFDFSDTSGRVKTAFDDLNLSVENWGTDFENAIKLITTPLSEGIASGEDAPATGTQITDEGAYETTAPYSGSGSSGGGTKYPQLAQMVVKGEGGVNSVNRGNAGDTPGGAKSIFGKNLTEMTVGEIMQAQREDKVFAVGKYQFIPTTLDGAVSYTKISLNARFDSATQNRLFDYLIDVKRPEIGAYINGKSNDRRTAIQQLAREFASVGLEYPEAGRGRGQSRYAGTGGNRASISPETAGESLDRQRKGGPVTSQSPQQSTPTPQQQSTPGAGQSFRPLPQGSFKGGERQRYLAPREGTRKHLGIDITESNWKRGTDPRIPVVAIRGGVVSSRDYVGGTKYDSGMVIDQDDGYSVRYLHMTPSVRPGQKVSAGQRIGRLVDLGDQTHLHIELFSGSKRLDPTSYITTIEKGGVPAAIATPQSPTPTPAQITPTGTPQNPQISQSLAPERTGPTVIVSQNPSSPAQQMMYSGGGGSSGGGSSQISDFALLNNFIKNKLLLDLAYL
jgi:murein DD-endopeptidase MepM/ murein hydrolase activator NlpD